MCFFVIQYYVDFFRRKSMKRKLLEKLQEACELITSEYQKQSKNSNVRFCVLQLLDIRKAK